MRPWGIAVPSWRLLALSLLWTSALGKDQPSVSVSKFDNAPVGISYFEDSDSVLFQDAKSGDIYYSKDAGVKWDRIKTVPEGKAMMLQMHPFDHKSAYILTKGKTHYKTENQGESWTEFKVESRPSTFQPDVLTFHAEDAKRIIYNGMNCRGFICQEHAIYTTENFKSSKMLRDLTNGCWWAKASAEFSTGDKDLDNKRILCIISDELSTSRDSKRLVVSDDFFALDGKHIQEFEPNMDTNKAVTGVVSLAIVKKYLLVATSSPRSDEMALFVTDDTLKWHRAIFPKSDSHDHSHQINQDAYTVLESTNYSIQIDVMTSRPSHPMGVLFTSNSNGTYFTENEPYTNRSPKGNVDFEKISNIQGVFMINTVENGPDVEKSGKDKVLVTKISFDDGRTFEEIKSGSDRIHLHSVSELDNVGRVFSSPAPGLIMGNGNKGKSLGKFDEADLYVSDDTGLHWKKALDGPHKYEFGDSGSILIAVKDSRKDDIHEISYSLDHGEKWQQLELPDGLKIRPHVLTTVQDSTSLKFILIGSNKKMYHIIAIDFEGLHEQKCGDGDMEDFHARVDGDGKEICVMGHKQTFKRRKKTANCFVKGDFHEPLAKSEPCECTDADFECDYNFQRDAEDNKKCKSIGPIVVPEGQCKDKNGKFKGSSGWRLIPGNSCKRKDGKQKDETVEHDCSGKETSPEPSPPASGDISHKQHVFDTKLHDFQKLYLEKGSVSTSKDETIIARPMQLSSGRQEFDGQIFLSSNHGKDWEPILKDEKIQEIYQHLYFQDVVYFTTEKDNKVIYTIDRFKSYHSFKTPTRAAGDTPLSFHPDKKDWLIWVGEKCDKVGGKESCFNEASLSTDRGDNWTTLSRFVIRCEFTGNSEYNYRSQKQIICLTHKEENKDSNYTVVTSDDFFSEDKTSFKEEVTNFATKSEFIVLAKTDPKTKDLQAFASLDGKKFEKAHFPYNFHETHGQEYTVLDSSSHAVNLFVRTSGTADREFGSIIKSNSNGTSYVLSASNVNCDSLTFVDFEKVSGLEGITLINVVTNLGKDEKKKTLQTKITHNDGSEWGYLAPPSKNFEGKSFQCSSGKGDSSCALHLHHYTEREDKRKTFAAETAIGLMFGVGNVGPALGSKKDADTFLTVDGGVTWTNVKKGEWTWQYGDQGSIILLVQTTTRENPVKTNIVSYSVDEGKTWKDYKFADEKLTITDVTTLKSGTSRNFLLWAKSDDGKMSSINIDFTGLTNKACKVTKDGDSDYYTWSPKHPLQNDDCLFGHVAKYLRKKTDRTCYNDQDIQRQYEFSNCGCSRRDYECAYNYELDNHGQCQLVSGMKPLSGKDWCEKNPNATSWFEPTGYRRIELSTCKGGSELEKNSEEHPCAGYEEEFERKHGTSGFAIFLSVIIPIGLAFAIGSYVYRNWTGKFGQIRLGESSATFDSDQPWIKYPVIAVSAVAAVVASLPLLVGGIFRSASGAFDRVGGRSGRSWLSSNRRFTTRDSFARSRGDYAAVDDVEGELLGEESDDEL